MNTFQDFKSEIKLFLFVALVAVVVSVGGILLLKTMQPVPSLTPAPTPQPQVLDTSGWQTYRNDEFGFEVKYPDGWRVIEEDTASVTKRLGDWFSKLNDTIILRGSEKQNIVIDILPIEAGRTIEEMMTIVTPILGENERGEFSTPGPGVLVTRSDPHKIGEHTFYTTGMSSYQSAGPYFISYYLPDSKDEHLIVFELTLAEGYGATPYYEYGVDEEPSYKVLKQILSTFRFVE